MRRGAHPLMLVDTGNQMVKSSKGLPAESLLLTLIL